MTHDKLKKLLNDEFTTIMEHVNNNDTQTALELFDELASQIEEAFKK